MQEVAVLTQSQIEQIVNDAVNAAVERLRPHLATPSDVVDRAGLAKHFRVSESTISRWMKQGLPYDRPPGAHPRFRISSCDQWRFSNCTKENESPPETRTGAKAVGISGAG